MNKKEFLNIVQNGEGIKTEFKTCSEKLPKNLFETICAFLNTKGGLILLGINDSGEISGINEQYVTRFKKEIANLANNPQKLSPAIFLPIENQIINDKIVITIEVPESSQVHKTNNIIFVRNQDGDYKVNHPIEIARIVNRKQNYHSEQKIFPQIRFSDFNSDLIDKAKELIKLNNPDNYLWKLTNKEFLTRIGFYTKNVENKFGYSLAAILFFGTDELIQSILPAYKIEALLRKENTDRYDDRLTLRTNLIDTYDLLMIFIEKHLNDPFYLKGTTRISLRSKIFRELVANIVTHREYMNPQPAFINIFKDKIEFTNPNNPAIFGKIDPKHFTPIAKNPTINKLMIQLGRAEDIGSGIRNVSKYLPYFFKDASVEFIDNEMFSTIIYLTKNVEKKSIESSQISSQISSQKGSQKSSQKSSQKILQLISEDSEITTEEMASAIGISRRAIAKQIKKLKNEKKLKRIGSDKGGYWKIENSEE